MSAVKVSDQRFAESKHRYTDPRTGERVVSVTSIVGCFDSGDKLGAGAGAAVKLTKAGIDYRKEWNEKKNLGSRVHGYASLWIEGKTADVLESDMGHMDGFARFCDEKHPEWVQTERAVVSSLGYGGKFDAVGWFDDQFVLCDFKTGRPWEAEVTLQLSGYRYADGMIVYDSAGNSTSLEPMPHIDACAGLYLTGDGKYSLVYCNVDALSFDAFESLLKVKIWATNLGKDQ